ncbi:MULTISPECIES: hypothetical protein [unclassified Frankia]|uniref:hypothetical protein n=1 Tax=unclassified Frankia TaxID=2632575 RepID=UPI001EE474A1|nr:MULTISPECIES: hypothetical protein [unclassified Frankia]
MSEMGSASETPVGAPVSGIVGIHHFGLTVRYIETSAAWYPVAACEQPQAQSLEQRQTQIPLSLRDQRALPALGTGRNPVAGEDAASLRLSPA